MYIWREEHNTNIRRNFDAKASIQLRNTLTGIRKARLMNKPPPDWISSEIYKDLEQLWDDPKYITKCEILKQAQNTVYDDRSSSLYTDGSIPMSKRGQELITLDGKGGFHPAKVNGAIMGCIKKHFTKAVKTYHEAPPELKELWFNEFRVSALTLDNNLSISFSIYVIILKNFNVFSCLTENVRMERGG